MPEILETYSFDDEFEIKLLAFLVRDKAFYSQSKPFVKRDYFENQLRRDIYERASCYSDKYNEAIPKEALRDEIKTMYHEQKKKDTDIDDYQDIIADLFQRDLTQGKEYAEEQIVNFARSRAMKIALKDGGDRVVGRKDLTPIEANVKEALKIGQTQTDEGGINMLEMQTKEFPADEYIVEPFMKPGEHGYLTAGYKVGKTMMVLQLLLSLSQGVSFLGFKVTKPRKALYIRFELTNREIQRRLKLMIHGMHSEIAQPSIFIGPKKGFDLTGKDRKDLEWTFRMIDKYEPEVLIFDPLYKVTALDIAAPKDAPTVLRAFAEIQQRYLNLHILTAHHPYKMSKDKDPESWDSTYGSMLLFADMDYEFRLRVKGDREDQRFTLDFLTNATPVDKMELVRDDHLLYQVTKETKLQKKEHRDSEDSEAMQTLLKAECGKTPEGHLQKMIFMKLCKEKLDVGRELFNRLCQEGDGIYWTVKVLGGWGHPVVFTPIGENLVSGCGSC